MIKQRTITATEMRGINRSAILEIVRREIFGPVIPIVTFDDLDEAIACANDSDYGLSAYVFTRDNPPHVASIERFISKKIERIKLDGFNYKYTALFEESKPGQPQGGFPGKVRGGRIRGGYHFAPGGRRR